MVTWRPGMPLSDDTLVVTSPRVLTDGEPVTLVIHQHDGTWQFVEGSTVEEGDALVVHFLDLLRRDGGLEALRRLRRGQLALRPLVGDQPWEIHPFGSDEELDSLFSG